MKNYFKKSITYLALGMTAILIIASCSKDEDPEIIINIDDLTNTNWVLDSITSGSNDFAIQFAVAFYNLFAGIGTEYNFNENGTFSTDLEDMISEGDWEFNSGTRELTLTYDQEIERYKIASISATKMIWQENMVVDEETNQTTPVDWNFSAN